MSDYQHPHIPWHEFATAVNEAAKKILETYYDSIREALKDTKDNQE